MIGAMAPVAALLLSVTILLMGNGLLGTLLPIRAQMELYTPLAIGILGASYFIGFAAGCHFGPHIVRRVGHIRTFIVMVSLTSAVTLAHALVLSPYVWWPLRTTTGFCFAVLYMVIESWLNEKSTNENRGLIFAIYSIISLTVLTIGQMMLTLANPSSFLLFAVASILVSLAALPVALTAATPPASIASTKIRMGHLYRISPVGFIAAIGVGAANGSFWSLGPVFAHNHIGSGDTTSIAMFMSIPVIAGAIGQWPLGWVSDRIDRRKVIAMAGIGAAASALAITVAATGWDQGIFIFAAAYGLFAFPLYTLSAAHMNDSVEANGFVETASGLLLLYSVGAIIGPLITSSALTSFGAAGLFGFTAVAHVAIVGFTLYRLRQHGRVPMEEREPFASSLLMAQTVAAIDPLAQTTDEPNAE